MVAAPREEAHSRCAERLLWLTKPSGAEERRTKGLGEQTPVQSKGERGEWSSGGLFFPATL